MMKKLKLLFVFGTRPEVIKIAPIIEECRKHSKRIAVKICISGQHRQMIDPLLKLFNIRPDFDLNIMQANQNLGYITSTVLEKVGAILDRENPDYLVVQGDTTTAMAAALAAYYRKIKVAHVEAGLRTGDKDQPFPEEINRRLIDSISDLYFAHTSLAKKNLLDEGVDGQLIEVTGNTVIDSLLNATRQKFIFKKGDLRNIQQERRKVILLTVHRRENMGEPLINICQALKELALRYAQEILIVCPVHLNPNIQKSVRSILGDTENIILTPPLEYLPFVHLVKKSYLVLTDSGGVQEEAPSLGKPVLVMRQTTERPEGVAAGCVKVIGTNQKDIVRHVTRLLMDGPHYKLMAQAKNPYGDGKASHRIVKRLLKRT